MSMDNSYFVHVFYYKIGENISGSKNNIKRLPKNKSQCSLICQASTNHSIPIKEISFKRTFIMNEHYKENIKIPDITIHIPIILR